MDAVRIEAPEAREREDRREVFARIHAGREPFEVWYRTGDAAIAPAAESFVAAALLPAMSLGLPLVVEAPLSPRFLASLDQIQSIYAAWEPQALRKVDIHASARDEREAKPPAAGVGSFFSGGIDSYYTLRKHEDEITHVVLIWGFDVPVDDEALCARLRDPIVEAMARLEKPLVEVETNHRLFLRDFALSKQLAHWLLAHGTCLAAVAQTLAPTLGRIFVPASVDYVRVVAWGTHPLLDPLWSTERVELVHDGCEKDRLGKLEAILDYPTALQTLRVCGTNTDHAYNCGRCEKCIAFMLLLHALGALERCETIDAAAFTSLPKEPLVTDDVNVIPHTAMANLLDAMRRLGIEPKATDAFERATFAKNARGRRFRRPIRRAADALVRAASRHYAAGRLHT